MISLHPEPRKVVSNHAFTQTFCFNYLFPEGNFGSLEKLFSSPRGILASLKEIICYPKEKWLLIRFWDRHTANWTLHCTLIVIRFLEIVNMNSLLTSSQKCEDSCTWFLRLNAIWTFYFTLQWTASNNLRALIAHGCGKSKSSWVITC